MKLTTETPENIGTYTPDGKFFTEDEWEEVTHKIWLKMEDFSPRFHGKLFGKEYYDKVCVVIHALDTENRDSPCFDRVYLDYGENDNHDYCIELRGWIREKEEEWRKSGQEWGKKICLVTVDRCLPDMPK